MRETESSTPKPIWRQRYEAWLEDRRGATAVEFGLVALPFFLLIFGLIEICMVFILSTTLEHGVTEAARQIRTGQFQEDGGDAGAFKALVCGNLFNLMDCDSKLNIDVRTFDDFNDAEADTPIKDGKFDSDATEFTPGAANEIVLVRVFYEWDVFTLFLVHRCQTWMATRCCCRRQPHSAMNHLGMDHHEPDQSYP